MTSTDLTALFSPRRIAVIGASDAPDKAGFAMMESLSTFPGEIVPINPRAERVWDRPAYPSVRAMPEPADLAVFVIPPRAVPDALEECAAAGVRAAVICSGGFGESGAEGAALEARIAEIAERTGIRVLGPNTSGFINPLDGVTANFMPAVRELTAGPVAVLAQSGGVNLALSFLLDQAGLGVRLAVGLGNAVDVGFTDVLDHLSADTGTRAIGLHVEGVGDGDAFVAALRRATTRKPVVVLKIGRNDVGEFAQSHTGAVTGSYRISRAAMEQAGAVVVDSPRDLVDALTALSAVRLAPDAPSGVGIVTGQAGPGLIVADALASGDVHLPELSGDTTATLSTLLPPLTYQRNPVDTGRPSETFPAVLRAVADDPAIGVLGIYALDEPGALDPVGAVSGLSTPVLLASGGPAEVLSAHRDALAGGGVPFFSSPDGLARGLLAVLTDQRLQLRRRDADADEPPAVGALPLDGPLDEDAGKDLLAALGVPVPRRITARTHEEAAEALRVLGPPVVVKVLDPAIQHKSDVGGVHVGVRDAAGLGAALDRIDAIPGDTSARRYLLEEQAGPGTELLVGALRDPAFGPVVVVGLGGVDVELAPPPVIRLAPLGLAEARSAVDELPAAVLDGHRGAPAVDRDALAALLTTVGGALASSPALREIDLNPVRMTDRGLLVLDALLVTD